MRRQYPWRPKWAGLLLAASASTSCGPGDGSTLDENGRICAHPTAPGIGSRLGGAVFAPDYGEIVVGFFEPYCVECHGGASPSRGLDLSFDRAHGALVGVPARGARALLVDVENPQGSYLLRKLEGRDISGRRMPRGRPPRSDSEIAVILDWIEIGAPRGTATSTCVPVGDGA